MALHTWGCEPSLTLLTKWGNKMEEMLWEANSGCCLLTETGKSLFTGATIFLAMQAACDPAVATVWLSGQLWHIGWAFVAISQHEPPWVSEVTYLGGSQAGCQDYMVAMFRWISKSSRRQEGYWWLALSCVCFCHDSCSVVPASWLCSPGLSGTCDNPPASPS